jgi:hypothetical protein
MECLRCILVFTLPYETSCWGVSSSDITVQPSTEQKGDPDDGSQVRPEAPLQLFAFLQILAATFASFARGGNDVRWVELETTTRACNKQVCSLRAVLASETKSEPNCMTFYVVFSFTFSNQYTLRDRSAVGLWQRNGPSWPKRAAGALIVSVLRNTLCGVLVFIAELLAHVYGEWCNNLRLSF